jgi:hypothetical protein
MAKRRVTARRRGQRQPAGPGRTSPADAPSVSSRMGPASAFWSSSARSSLRRSAGQGEAYALPLGHRGLGAGGMVARSTLPDDEDDGLSLPRRHASWTSQHASGPPGVMQCSSQVSQIQHTSGRPHSTQVKSSSSGIRQKGSSVNDRGEGHPTDFARSQHALPMAPARDHRRPESTNACDSRDALKWNG